MVIITAIQCNYPNFYLITDSNLFLSMHAKNAGSSSESWHWYILKISLIQIIFLSFFSLTLTWGHFFHGSQRDHGREKEKYWRERETSITCFLYTPRPGIKSATWVCALTESRTCNLSVYGTMLQLARAKYFSFNGAIAKNLQGPGLCPNRWQSSTWEKNKDFKDFISNISYYFPLSQASQGCILLIPVPQGSWHRK